MSELICPFCQQELKYDAWNEVYMCRNPNCKHLLGFGTKELWQELMRTKKQLDLALKELKQLKYGGKADRTYLKNKAGKALEQITALEQKE